MPAIALLIAFLIPSTVRGGEYENQIAIALELARHAPPAASGGDISPEPSNTTEAAQTAGDHQAILSKNTEKSAGPDILAPVNTPKLINGDFGRPTRLAPRQEYREVRVTKYRMETRCFTDRWGRKSCRRVKVPYTVKKLVPAYQAEVPPYPLRERHRWWSGCPDYRHLLRGVHAKYRLDPEWLKRQSNATIQSIHSDLHEGTVLSKYLVTLD